jgi:hypothetical protein
VILLVGNAVLVLTAVLAVTFCVLYTAWEPWWRSELGRHLFTYSAVVAAVLVLSVIRVVSGVGLETPWFQALRLITFAGMPFVIGWRIAILWRIHRDKVRDRAS